MGIEAGMAKEMELRTLITAIELLSARSVNAAESIETKADGLMGCSENTTVGYGNPSGETPTPVDLASRMRVAANRLSVSLDRIDNALNRIEY